MDDPSKVVLGCDFDDHLAIPAGGRNPWGERGVVRGAHVGGQGLSGGPLAQLAEEVVLNPSPSSGTCLI